MRWIRFVLTVLSALGVFFIPLIVFGQPCECSPVDVTVSASPEQQTWWMAIISNLLPAVGSLAVMVITTFVGIAVRKWGHKIDADKQTALTMMINDFVKAGVGFAEEQGRKALREGKETTDSADKMNAAMQFVMQRFEASGMQQIGEEELGRLIESRVARERAKPGGVVKNTPSISETTH